MAGDAPIRLTFEDFWQGNGPPPEALNGIPRLADAADAAAGQVVADGPVQDGYIPIDALAGHHHVDSVVGDGPVMSGVSLPSVREIFVIGHGTYVRLTPPTAGNLPNLERLAVSWADTRALVRLPELRDVVCHELLNPDLLPQLHRLRRLKVGREMVGVSADLLVEMTDLRWLVLIGWKGLRSLGRLTMLERLVVQPVAMADLRAWRSLGNLIDLSLNGRLKALDGIEALERLERLSLGITDRVDLAPIGSLTGLRELSIDVDGAPSTLPIVGGLRRLRRFSLDLGDEIGRLPTIDFLAGLVDLEEVKLWGIDLEDRRLDPLIELPRLQRLTITGNAGPDVDEFRRRRPDVEITARLAGEPEGRFRIGFVSVDRSPGGDRWWIRQDLARHFAYDSQDDAEDLLQRTLRRHQAALFERLSWDSESGGVGVYASSEEDVRAVAEVINELAANRLR